VLKELRGDAKAAGVFPQLVFALDSWGRSLLYI